MQTKSYRILVTGLISAWFVLALAASAQHVYAAPPGHPPVALLITVLIPLATFTIWYTASAGFREFLHSLDVRALTRVHAWRVIGFTFLAFYTYRLLPGMFALPAGWGDIAIGATALYVASKMANPAHRTTFIIWQFLGVADLLIAVSVGALGAVIRPEAFSGPVTMAPMAELPLSLIPTFGVPLLLLIHIVSIAQAWGWSEERVKGELRPAVVRP